MVEPIFDYQFRLILIGDSTVGKSSLLKYFTDGKFAEVYYCVLDYLDQGFPKNHNNYIVGFRSYGWR